MKTLKQTVQPTEHLNGADLDTQIAETTHILSTLPTEDIIRAMFVLPLESDR